MSCSPKGSQASSSVGCSAAAMPTHGGSRSLPCSGGKWWLKVLRLCLAAPPTRLAMECAAMLRGTPTLPSAESPRGGLQDRVPVGPRAGRSSCHNPSGVVDGSKQTQLCPPPGPAAPLREGQQAGKGPLLKGAPQRPAGAQTPWRRLQVNRRGRGALRPEHAFPHSPRFLRDSVPPAPLPAQTPPKVSSPAQGTMGPPEAWCAGRGLRGERRTRVCHQDPLGWRPPADHKLHPACPGTPKHNIGPSRSYI